MAATAAWAAVVSSSLLLPGSAGPIAMTAAAGTSAGLAGSPPGAQSVVAAAAGLPRTAAFPVPARSGPESSGCGAAVSVRG